MDQAVVHIEVSSVVGVDDFGGQFFDEAFDDLHYFQKGDGVEPVVREAEQTRLGPAEQTSCFSTGFSQGRDQPGFRFLSTVVPRGHPLAEDGDVHSVPFPGEPGDGAAAAEDLVVRVRRNDQNGSRRTPFLAHL
jgi:hypothetical protein